MESVGIPVATLFLATYVQPGRPVPAIEWRFQSNKLYSINDDAVLCDTP